MLKMESKMNSQVSKIVFIVALCFCVSPYIDPPLALLLGFVLAQTSGHPYIQFNSKVTSWLLKISVVGLGFGMNLSHAIDAGKEGFYFTIFSIAITLLFGRLFGKWLKVDGKTSFLISSGTAICGGSAIAAVAPIIKADEKQMSMALGTVFILNSIALIIFPTIGHLLNLSQHQFGIWSAIAIHDTSSVVGAASKYGEEALRTATTIKLERALWIIPLSIMTAIFTKGKGKKISIPYFIGFFILAMVISYSFPTFKQEYLYITFVAKKGLTITLFLIGAGLSIKNLQALGIKPIFQGILLWILISCIALGSVFMID